MSVENHDSRQSLIKSELGAYSGSSVYSSTNYNSAHYQQPLTQCLWRSLFGNHDAIHSLGSADCTIPRSYLMFAQPVRVSDSTATARQLQVL